MRKFEEEYRLYDVMWEIEITYYRLSNLLNVKDLLMDRKTVATEDELRLDQTT